MRGAGETHYDVLGLPERASGEQLESAYRHASSLYADDALATYTLLDPDERHAARTRVEEAYAVLRDPGRRREYDALLGIDRGGPPEVDALAAPLAPSAAPASALVRRPPPVSLPDPVSGADLKRFREGRGVALRDIAAASKVCARFLEYIEADRTDALPAPVYLRGFLHEYARAVGLDPGRTAESYLRRTALRP